MKATLVQAALISEAESFEGMQIKLQVDLQSPSGRPKPTTFAAFYQLKVRQILVHSGQIILWDFSKCCLPEEVTKAMLLSPDWQIAANTSSGILKTLLCWTVRLQGPVVLLSANYWCPSKNN